ncbi:MAG: hypothetical protein JWO38_5083 [Gemmataceae bacterium]|nr:hypothetical protein [Gemmataceae bacterium]
MGKPGVWLATAVAAVILTGGAGLAQLPEAPLPHPPLDEWVTEYRRLGLPVPPPDAELVRIELAWAVGPLPEHRKTPPYLLGFRLPPARPGDPPRFLIGEDQERPIDPLWAEPVEPNVDALREVVEMRDTDYLCLAAQCKLRGLDDFARQLYARAQAEHQDPWDEAYSSIVKIMWYGQLTNRNVDRKAIIRRLKEIITEQRERAGLSDYDNSPFYHPFDHLRSLEQTVAPRKAKPGSVEALIDELTDHWHEYLDPENEEGHQAYWKLAELGFDAVPALIDHLRDDRLTRAVSEPRLMAIPYHLKVGDLAGRLLWDLSARTTGGGYWTDQRDRLNPDKARAWFAAAQKIGEEKWLVDHAVPTDGGGAIVNQWGRPERLIVRVIGAKYPARLPAIYRAVLKQPVSYSNRDYIQEIQASKLTREQKIALFEEGAGHTDLDHRLLALEGLAGVDPESFRKHLLLTLKQVRAKSETGERWWPNPFRLVPLVERAGDPGCWDALAAVARSVPHGERLDLILSVGYARSDRPDPIRRERLRFLVPFLEDSSAERNEDEKCDRVAVRDYTASQLAGLLGLRVNRNESLGVRHDPDRGPVYRFVLRQVVRRAAEQELARPKK